MAGDYPEAVHTTWTKSFEAVKSKSAAAADLLTVSAFLAPDRIPYEILVKGAPHLGETLAAALANAPNNARGLNKLLTLLTRYSLIRRNIESRTYDIHRLVQAVIRDGMDELTRGLWAERTVRAVDEATPPIEFDNWPDCDRLLPHWSACADQIEQFGLVFAEAVRLLNQAGYYLDGRARYAEAEPLFRRALAIREKTLDEDHTVTATSLNDLGVLLRLQGRFMEAEPLLCRALAIREKALGPDHPDTATSLINLALLRQDQRRLEEAEPLLRRGLAIREKALGEDHRETARTLNDLGGLLRAQDRYVEAERLYRQARAIWEKALRRELAIREKALGPDHPDTAYPLNDLGGLLRAQDRYVEAEPLYRRALAIREKALGPDHPDTAASLNDLGVLLRLQGRFKEAEPLLCRALAIREKPGALGPDHPDTAASLNHLAELYRDQGRYIEAEPLYRRALAIREKALGPDHRETAASLNDLGVLLRLQGRFKEAEPVLCWALAIREKPGRWARTTPIRPRA